MMFNEHVAEAAYCLRAPVGRRQHRLEEGRWSYQSGPCRVWIKVRNPASIAVQRERSEIWDRRARRPVGAEFVPPV